MNLEELVKFQRKMARDYPYYPIDVKDWNKMNELNISVKGLEQLSILKRQIIHGNYTSEDIVLFLRLLELYASTNPTHQRLRDYKKHHDLYFEHLLKTHYRSNLIKENLAVKNTKYNPKFREQWNTWQSNIIKECYRLGKMENEK